MAAVMNQEERFVKDKLAQFDYELDTGWTDKATQFLLHKLMQMCENPDPLVSLRGIEHLGKTAYCSLFTSRVQVNFSSESDAELRQRLESILAKTTIDITSLQD